MRRFLTVCTLVFAAGSWFLHAQQPTPREPAARPAVTTAKAAPARPAPFTLSIDSIMTVSYTHLTLPTN